MGMSETSARWTAQMVRELPDDGNRYEVVHGQLLVTPSPGGPHQLVLARLYAAIRAYLEPLSLGDTVLFSPADISWGEDSLVQPDLFVFPPGEWTGEWRSIRTLLLAVEVLSPSSRRADRVIKRRAYQEQRVETYWIVDTDDELVDVWHPDDAAAQTVKDVVRWRVRPDLPELQIVLSKLFQPFLR